MAGSNRRVVIITRTKNRPLLLQRAILSVKNQTYSNYIHVIVNDGGPPNDVIQVLRDSGCDGRVQAFNIDSKGHMEVASNDGIRLIAHYIANLDASASKSVLYTHGLAPNDLIIIHDDDDSWSPEFLSVMTSELDRYQELAPSVTGIICRANRVYEKIDGNVILTDHFEPHASVLPEVGILDTSDLFDDRNNFAPIQFLYEYRAWVELDGYNPQLTTYGDWDFNLRFLEKYDIAAIPNYLAFYHWRLSSTGVDFNSIVGRNYQKETCRQVVLNRLQRKYGNVSIYSKIAQIQTELVKLGERVDALQQNIQHASV